MARHSKWSKVKHIKAVVDKKRGKVFTKHAKLIAVAARNGGDLGMNPGLRSAIDNARAENLPMDNIERAIKKGTGEGKDAAVFEEIFYEGYGPGGVAILIETFTENKNRTVQNVKDVVKKNGGNIGSAGSVAYLFKKIGQIEVYLEGKSEEDVELLAIDAGADEVYPNFIAGENDEDIAIIEVVTSPNTLMQVRSKLAQAGLKIGVARMTYIPNTLVEISNEETAKGLFELIDAIEEDEDVSMVYHNGKFLV